jgi:hypothetical protein
VSPRCRPADLEKVAVEHDQVGELAALQRAAIAIDELRRDLR